MYINPGDFKSLITIQEKVVSYNSYHEAIEEWIDFSRAWAAVVTSGSREFYAAQKMFTEASVIFRIRYRSGITTLQRIKMGDRYFEILGAPIDVENRHRQLQIITKEVF